MQNWESLLTVAVVIGLMAGLALRVAAAELLALAALAVLVVAGSLVPGAALPTPAEAFQGFGSESLVTIALLFVVVAGLELTGGAELATGWFLNGARKPVDARMRLLVPVAVVSGFLNNTPVVAGMLPVVNDLSKKIGDSSSRFLMPMSYAAILGGMCTLIGTSTNMVIRDLYVGQTGQPLGFFTPAWIGVPATVVGLVYLIFGSRLLPDRKPGVSLADDPQQYTVEMQVERGGNLVGKTIEQAGLRRLPGLYVAEIQRVDEQGESRIVAARPGERLWADDVLILVGALESVVDLKKIRGLITPDDQARKLQVPAWRRTLVEAVVSPRCSSLGKSIRESRFRSRYNAAVVAVARGGKRVEGKLGDIRLEVGDVLLLEASPSFLHRQQTSRDFYLVSQVEQGAVRRPERAWTAITIVLLMVFAAAFTAVPISVAALVAAVATVATRCCRSDEARRSVDWAILIVIGAAIGIGSALEKSGAAKAIADGLLSLAGRHPYYCLAAVYLATMICTEFVTNVAAATLMFYIATQTAANLNVDETPFVIAVMIAASASFLTPFGYQTNAMVYGVGGYRFGDYVRFGLPLTLIVFAVAMVVIPRVFPF
ncbi:SLC13 family permease [Crateriforma spongiae]|uniref:SLC13 family permease n=1 Tax=Crateriforma spongiae TaxID=2724528 RepID=UPI00144673B7|nr:SLC13 family permease [Crateriforma spongiae]